MNIDETQITIVAAIARNRAIGVRGGMPWHLPDELRHFRDVTMDKPIVMGRRTFQSIGRALPGRRSIVVSRNPSFKAPGCEMAGSLEEAIELAAAPEVMIIGGGELYRQALPIADRLLLTRVDCTPGADTFFPQWQSGGWELKQTEEHPADEEHEYAFEFQVWVRADSGA
ncbi:MAG: dihydrofolate reductase [Xanthomonadales bacterium]|nr:dihydrofolate reductase [Xanthomonadales bacterium]